MEVVAGKPSVSFMQHWEALIKKVNRYLMYGAMVFTALCALFATIDVFNRLAGQASITWAQQAADWSNVICVFLAAPVLMYQGGLLTVDFIINKLKGATKRTVHFINQVGTVAYTTLALWGVGNYVVYLKVRDIRRYLGSYYFPYYIIAVFAFLGILVMLIWSIQRVLGAFQKEEKK